MVLDHIKSHYPIEIHLHYITKNKINYSIQSQYNNNINIIMLFLYFFKTYISLLAIFFISFPLMPFFEFEHSLSRSVIAKYIFTSKAWKWNVLFSG